MRHALDVQLCRKRPHVKELLFRRYLKIGEFTLPIIKIGVRQLGLEQIGPIRFLCSRSGSFVEQ